MKLLENWILGYLNNYNIRKAQITVSSGLLEDEIKLIDTILYHR